jgi:hypothetical protein
MSLISQIAAEQAAGPLLIYGPLGIVCAWLMWKIERMETKMTDALGTKLGDLAHRIDGLTKALLVDMVNREDTGIATKKYANEAISKIDARVASESKK